MGDTSWGLLGPSNVDAMDVFAPSQARNTVIIEVSKCVHGLFFPLCNPSINFGCSLSEQGDRRRQTQALGTTHLEGYFGEPFRGREGAQVRRILLRLQQYQRRPEGRYV